MDSLFYEQIACILLLINAMYCIDIQYVLCVYYQS